MIPRNHLRLEPAAYKESGEEYSTFTEMKVDIYIKPQAVLISVRNFPGCGSVSFVPESPWVDYRLVFRVPRVGHLKGTVS
jgi:hypothetical protein